MKIKLRSGSSLETIDLDVENIRSNREQLQYCNKHIDEILKPYMKYLNLKWYQKLYLKLASLIKNRKYKNLRIYVSSRHYWR